VLRGLVQRELQQLTAAGLVHRDVRGNQVYFQANRKAAIFPELQRLFVKTTASTPAKRRPAGLRDEPKGHRDVARR